MSNKDKAKSQPTETEGGETKQMSYASYKQALQNDHTLIKLRAEIAQYRLMEFMNLSQLAKAQGEVAAMMKAAENSPTTSGDPSEAPTEEKENASPTPIASEVS